MEQRRIDILTLELISIEKEVGEWNTAILSLSVVVDDDVMFLLSDCCSSAACITVLMSIISHGVSGKDKGSSIIMTSAQGSEPVSTASRLQLDPFLSSAPSVDPTSHKGKMTLLLADDKKRDSHS